MRIIPFREALREAMNEEMRRDNRVFLMGEEVAEYNGAYKVSQGMLAEFGERHRISHANVREIDVFHRQLLPALVSRFYREV